ncbi:MAG TPA: methyltransferase domain-containing protein [Saprospiraceae bacterium]|nr:methyltransferase domain-containing protein [Saprospiraceae bacterium]HPQ21044.1 methyltransferase domain-containing protein [Saprospiraceae bacterium]HRX28535.1 methyltransferase domain-containing protein [Saprospiraceae bacterium]
MRKLDENYWSARYMNGEAGWDLGYASPPLMEYAAQLDNKSLKILIPGAGNSWEIEGLYKMGFTNLTVCDISEMPINNIKNRMGNSADDIHFIHDDFFNLSDQYDLILEQTFFCALDPDLRKDYVQKVMNSLNSGGKLVGVLFGIEFETEGPPFGGRIEEYQSLFQPYFDIRKMEICRNSISKREGNEIFINLSPK